MFERGERNRRADRARMAALGGYVGRNVGDAPYIMDLVLLEHFASLAASGGAVSGTPFFYTSVNSGDLAVAVPTSVVLRTGATASSSITIATATLAALNGYTRDASIRSRWQISAIDATTTLLIGFRSSGDVLSAADGLFVGAIGSISQDYFGCVSRSGGVATTAILDGAGGKANIPIDTAWHDASIVCDSTAGEVRFYVDRQLAATITTDIPTGSLAVVAGAENGLTGGTSRTLTIDVIMASESAP